MAEFKMIALKAMKYETRHLQAGDDFVVSGRRNFTLHQITGKARPFDANLDAKKPAKVKQDDELATLRTEYKEKVGKQPFYGWDADTLREKLAES